MRCLFCIGVQFCVCVLRVFHVSVFVCVFCVCVSLCVCMWAVCVECCECCVCACVCVCVCCIFLCACVCVWFTEKCSVDVQIHQKSLMRSLPDPINDFIWFTFQFSLIRLIEGNMEK